MGERDREEKEVRNEKLTHGKWPCTYSLHTTHYLRWLRPNFWLALLRPGWPSLTRHADVNLTFAVALFAA
jgi:hypothetical protein